MTNLTEQWKKGELPEGHYYVKDGKSMIAEYLGGFFYNDGEPMRVDEVLGRVPSFEFWKAVHEQWKVLLEENTKLKAVLKRCREFVDDFSTNNDEVWAYKNAVLNGIDELLGEE